MGDWRAGLDKDHQETGAGEIDVRRYQEPDTRFWKRDPNPKINDSELEPDQSKSER